MPEAVISLLLKTQLQGKLERKTGRVPPSLWPHPGRAVTCLLLHWFPTPCPGA